MARFDAEYNRRHDRARRALGQARLRECAHCGGQAQEWATIHDRDGWNFTVDYMALCKKCHAAYDERGRKISAAKTGLKMSQPMSEESRRKKSEAHRRYWAGLTDEQRAARIAVWRASRWPEGGNRVVS